VVQLLRHRGDQVIADFGDAVFRYRNALFPVASLLLLLPGPPLFANGVVAIAAGLVVALAGQSIRAFTIGYDYIIRGGRNGRVYAEGLVTGGAYQLCRNPMYVGNMLILCGLAIASNTWTCLLVAVAAFGFFYVAIVAAEERFLEGKFGAGYRDYVRAVPRWIPSRATLGSLAGGFGHIHWRRILVKEYGTPMGWWVLLVFASWVQLRRSGQLQPLPGLFQALLIGGAALAVAWLVIRVLKKSRRLTAD
jgi:protein-S-isoprenylcysteine O-methyltransferase Ste14